MNAESCEVCVFKRGDSPRLVHCKDTIEATVSCFTYHLKGDISLHVFPTWAHQHPLSIWASDHITWSSSADGFSQFPHFSELFWMNILKNLSGHTYKRTYDIWLKAFFLCHRWCQVIADSGQSWYIQVSNSSLQTLLFSFECVEGSALTPTLCLQNPKHRHYGSHWCGEDNDHREDALLLWLHESTWRCVGWQK